MSFYRETQVRATFKKLGVDANKASITFELSGDSMYTLPTLACMTGEKVELKIQSDQTVLLLNEGTGEVIDQENPDQLTIDEAEEADDGDEEELPPAAQEFEPDEELDDIFGKESAA